MADNRMYLVHRPTGRSVYLASGYGGVWEVNPDIAARLERLLAENLFDCDYCLALENASQAPFAAESGEMVEHTTVEGFRVFKTPIHHPKVNGPDLAVEVQELQQKLAAAQERIHNLTISMGQLSAALIRANFRRECP